VLLPFSEYSLNFSLTNHHMAVNEYKGIIWCKTHRTGVILYGAMPPGMVLICSLTSALMTGWRELARKEHQPAGVLLLRGILKQLTAGYKTYQKLG
jgi:hypothetical protein